MSYLENIDGQESLQKLRFDELNMLCDELRSVILDRVSRNGGHLASNLGVIELTVALDRVFDSRVDRIIFDVGHQTYAHKLLTGRTCRFETLRKFGGISGFPKPCESVSDAFSTGHASTSISAGLGMARARTLRGENYHVVSVIGDGALTGGLAYEALNDAGQSREKMIVVLNDNGMSIRRNCGGMSKALARLRLKPQYSHFKNRFRLITEKTPGGKRVYRFVNNTKNLLKKLLIRGSMFEEMGFTYLGPVDGHDIKSLCTFFEIAKAYSAPVLIHIKTDKGRGYQPASDDPSAFHGVSPFDFLTGEPIAHNKESFSDVFGKKLCTLAENDKNICAITAAMQDGTGLNGFAAKFPKRFFDVAIAEGHAVTMSSGMAIRGMIPVFAVYSSFLQRAYDMLIHDAALQKLHVVLAVDRAGITGEDGETHQGLFDGAFLPQIPGIGVYAPSSFAELGYMLENAIYNDTGLCAVRYPRGSEGAYKRLSKGDWEIIRSGGDLTIVSYGILINEAIDAANKLAERNISADIVKINRIAPLKAEGVIESVTKTGKLIVAEECIAEGSVGMRLASELFLNGICCKAELLNVGQRFLQQGSIGELRKLCGIDAEGIFKAGLKLTGA